MKEFFNSNIGRFRLLSALEGLSLLLLVFVSVPLKYIYDMPTLTTILGPIHGVLFLLVVLCTILLAIKYNWKFKTTLIVLIATVVPFGTFYVDYKILKPLHKSVS